MPGCFDGQGENILPGKSIISVDKNNSIPIIKPSKTKKLKKNKSKKKKEKKK